MIVWVKAEAAKMPCDQRAEIIRILPDLKRLHVELCGTREAITINCSDISGIELEPSSPSDKISLKFKVTTVSRLYT